jgi:Uma2 family endonuclease
MENSIQEPAFKYNFYSPQEYLEIEHASEEKHEYFDGQIYNMSGASLKHTRVARNLIFSIAKFLEGKNCEVLSETLRVTNAQKDAYMYPDLVILCGKEELEDDKFDTLVNPSVIFEIISPSSRSIDKGRKLFYYKGIPSLKEYFMIETSLQKVHIVRKQPNGDWRFADASQNSDTIFIETINFHLSLSDIYNGTGIE